MNGHRGSQWQLKRGAHQWHFGRSKTGHVNGLTGAEKFAKETTTRAVTGKTRSQRRGKKKKLRLKWLAIVVNVLVLSSVAVTGLSHGSLGHSVGQACLWHGRRVRAKDNKKQISADPVTVCTCVCVCVCVCVCDWDCNCDSLSIFPWPIVVIPKCYQLCRSGSKAKAGFCIWPFLFSLSLLFCWWMDVDWTLKAELVFLLAAGACLWTRQMMVKSRKWMRRIESPMEATGSIHLWHACGSCSGNFHGGFYYRWWWWWWWW